MNFALKWLDLSSPKSLKVISNSFDYSELRKNFEILVSFSWCSSGIAEQEKWGFWNAQSNRKLACKLSTLDVIGIIERSTESRIWIVFTPG